jgi:hypothetical protein
VGGVWPLLFVLMVATAPEPADPNAVPSVLDSLLALALFGGLVATTTAAVVRHWSALLWSAGLGALWVGTTILCPASGHHDTVGWQWSTELMAASALLVLSVLGADRLRAR